MRKIALAILAAVLLCAQTPMLPGFPPGVFQSRAPFDATVSVSYSGLGDVQSGAKGYWGLRAYNAAYATANGNIADIVDTATGTFSCTIKAKTNGDADLSSLLCTGSTLSVTTFCTITHAAGCSIKKLYDQSGALFCLGSVACDLSQATLANMPTLVLNCINSSLPCMAGNGSQSLSSAVNAGTAAAANPFTGVFVANRTPTSSSVQGIMSITSNITWRFAAATSTVESYNGSPLLPASATDAQFHSFVSVLNGSSSEWFIDNVNTTGTVGAAGLSANIINLLLDTFSGSSTVGDLTEFAFYTSSLDSVKVNLCNNERLYYGTPGAC